MDSRYEMERLAAVGFEHMKDICEQHGVDIEGTHGSMHDQFTQLEERFKLFSIRESIKKHESRRPRYREEGLASRYVSLPMTSEDECSTTAQVSYWAGSVAFHKEFVDLRKQVLHRDRGERVVRKFAGINGAFKRGYYEVSQYASYDFPSGATGKKIAQPKLAPGGKGLRRPGDADVPDDDDIYVPKGISRKLENRPPHGRWYFPRPSKLSKECTP